MPVLTKINTNSIAEDAITGDKFAGDAYLANTATQNISGTYSENRLYTSDAYTLSGNATINSNITLSTVKSTGDVVLTAGGAYTITGTGVLSGGSMFTNTPQRTDLTGMTGELGSVVTLPAGSVVQVQSFTAATAQTSTSTSMVEYDFGGVEITPKYQDSKFLVTASFVFRSQKSGTTNASTRTAGMFELYRKVTGGSNTTIYGPVEQHRQEGSGSTASGFMMHQNNSLSYLDAPNTTSKLTYVVRFRTTYSGWTAIMNGKASAGNSDKGYTITVMEIKS